MRCRHRAGGGFRDAGFEVLSSERLAAEIARLDGMTEALEGAACGCSGRRSGAPRGAPKSTTSPPRGEPGGAFPLEGPAPDGDGRARAAA